MRSLLVAILLGSATALSAQELRPAYSELGHLGDGRVFQVMDIPGGLNVLYNFSSGRNSAGELRVFGREAAKWHRIGAGESDLALSPRGGLLAFMRGDEKDGLHIWTQRISGRTGRLEGVARRVSLRKGRGPTFSPDGRWIAYAVLPTSRDTSQVRVVVVPAVGGPERVLVRGDGFAQNLKWSPDGQWLYYRYRAEAMRKDPRSGALINRVSLRSGRTETVRKVREFIGISSDGRFLAYYPLDALDNERTVVEIATADGVEIGRITLPRMLQPSQWAATGLKLLAVRHYVPRGVRVTSFHGGAARPLSPTSGVFDGVPSWSPDGKQLAFATLLNDHRQLVVVSASGGPRRHVPTRAEPDGDAPVWSPDGRHLAFTSQRGGSLHAVEIATGAESRLAGADRVDAARVVWRRDGRALVYVRQDATRLGIREVTLGGVESTLRNLSGELAEGPVVTLVGDSAMVIATRSGVFAAPLRGSGSRRIFTPSVEEDPQWTRWGVSVSRDGRYAAVPVWSRSGGREQDVVHITPLGAGSRRAVPLSYISYVDRFHWHPDGHHLVVTGSQDNRSPHRIQLVPLNGEPIRTLTTDARTMDDWGPTISPDGRLLAHGSTLGARSVFYEMDLTRALAARLQAAQH